MIVFWIDMSLFDILLFLIFVLSSVLWLRSRRPANYPPGPTPLPIIGNLHNVAKKDFMQAIRDLRHKYGDIISLSLGSYWVVFVNGSENLRELFVKNANETSDRPPLFIFKLVKNKGVIASSGANWKHQRTFALSKLRDFGFGKRSFESSILEEIENFLNLFESFKGKSFDLPGIIRTSLSNNVMSITVGRRFEYDDPKFRYFVNLLDEVNNTAALSGALNFIPILEKLPGDPFGAKRILEVANEFFDNFFGEELKEHRETLDENNIRDFIDAYLVQMKTAEASNEYYTGETRGVCNHPSTRSICKTTDFGLDIHHDICFLKKTYTNGGVTYERGGTTETVCRKNAALSSLSNLDCKSPNPPVNTVCYDCCIGRCVESRVCNQENNINPNFMPSYMKIVPAPTTTTTLPTTTSTSTSTTTTLPTTASTSTTTTLPTTASTSTTTTLPTTASTSTTTTLPTTSSTSTATVNGIKCLVCTEDQSNSCSSVDYAVCIGEKPYCLNEIIYQNGKWIKTLHRCASKVECYWDYWIGTGSGTDCIQNGVCVYCCQKSNGHPCNAVTEKPTSLSNFGQPQNRAYKCAVTGSQNSNTIQDCPPSERFCLNDVYYDTDPNTKNLITRDVRRCASQEQCKAKWLQSRKTDACLTGNMTGVDASKTRNMLLCHYCCESNTMTPCNLHPKPDQIKLFIQPTTLPIVSSTAVCQDKPGVDCLLLNTTNICANPAAQQYCAAFCGHC